ncbi:MAG: hypothetical protein M1300_11445 [Epsilonproteobacteria bacterium]|nr:hypothetical protein [Campylobacterota bacterium]
MSIKENIQTLKDELSAEEKFIESAIRTERFVKKYQKPLIASVISLLFAVGGAIAYQSYDQAKIENSNEALSALLANPDNAEALKNLEKENSKLHELYTLSKAIKVGDVKALRSLMEAKSPEIADIAAYETAVLMNDQKALESYAKKQDAIYQDMALIEMAVMLIQKGDTASANSKLALIKEDSVMYPTAQTLSHFGVKE